MRFHNYPKLLEEYYVQRLRETYRARQERLARVTTPEEARQYVEEARKGIRKAFGPLPPRTPLNARTVKTTDFGEYLIEHVLYESRPELLVSANLYLPKERKGRVPGVLFTCGHSYNGKAYPLYMKTCIRLAREGYAVLAYDPINQGERDIYRLGEVDERLTRMAAVAGHNIIGRQMHACSEWFGAWRLWDGLRGVDYLASRPEIDRDKLGLTGQSGGGTLSAYIWSMEPRLRAVASSCWTTSYLLDLENSMPADDEQYPPGFLASGLDKIDFFMARAGTPALLLGQEFDYFDNRGLQQGHAELLRLHRLLGGTASTCRLNFDCCQHSYSDGNQIAMLQFFNEIFGKPPTTQAADEQIEVPEEEQITAAPDGDVHRAGSRPVYAMVAERAERAADRPAVAPEKLPAVICTALNITPPKQAPHHRRLFLTEAKRGDTGQQIYRFIVESEPGIQCVLRHVCREGNPFRLMPDEQAILYLPNIDSQQELADAETMQGADDFWTLDPRGLGEGLFTLDDPLGLYGHDYMYTGYALMFNEPLLGRRVFDVLNAVQLLRAEGAREVHLVGRRQGAVLALLAAALDPAIATVAAREAPESVLALSTAQYTFWQAVNFPHAMLQAFDLPDVRDALGMRLVEDTWADAQGFRDREFVNS
ncbi:MAG: alpha/beta hydrolase family protein [Armatimonadota bacterium]